MPALGLSKRQSCRLRNASTRIAAVVHDGYTLLDVEELVGFKKAVLACGLGDVEAAGDGDVGFVVDAERVEGLIQPAHLELKGDFLGTVGLWCVRCTVWMLSLEVVRM